MRRIRLAVLAGLAAAGCSPRGMGPISIDGTAKPARMEVKDEHFARLPQDGLQDVESMREEIRAMKDEALRAEQEQRIGDHEVAIAQAKLEAARADVDVAKAEVQLATATGERGLVDDAEQALEKAQNQVEVQRWKGEVAARHRDELNLDAQVIRDRIGIAQAKLEQAKLEALQNADDVAAAKYDAEAFAKQIENAEARLARTEELIATNARAAEDAQAKLEQAEALLEQVPVRGEEEDIDEEQDPRDAEPLLDEPVPNEPGDGGMPQPVPVPQ